MADALAVLRITPMIKSLLDRFERNGLRRISSWILALMTAGWVVTLTTIYKGLWLDGVAIVPIPEHIALLTIIALQIIGFYIVRTVLPLYMRIYAVAKLGPNVDKLLSSTPDPDPIEDPPPRTPSLDQIEEDIVQYRRALTNISTSQEAEP